MTRELPEGKTPVSVSYLIAWAVLAVGVLGLLWPALSAPLSADERYQYLMTAARSGGTLSGVFEYTWQDNAEYLELGRIAYFAYLIQRFFYLAVTLFSVSTGTSIVVGHAIVKMLMFTLAIASFTALLRAVRRADTPGAELQKLSGVTIRRATLLFAILLCCGVQTQVFTRSSWVAYPVLTWGAISVMFGTTWLVLRLATAVSKRRLNLWYSLPLLLALAIFLNTSYELYYVAVPLAVLMLIAHGVKPDGAGRQWLPKLYVGGALVGFFVAIFLAIRWYIASLCADETCYSGVEPNLGVDAVRTGTMNFLTAVPLFGKTEALDAVARVDSGAELAGPFSGAGWFFGFLVVLGLVVVYPRISTVEAGRKGATAQREGPLLVTVALYGFAMAAGTSLIMGLSVLAQEQIIVSLGVPYRSSTVAWAGLVMVLVGLVLVPTSRGFWGHWPPLFVTATAVLYAGIVVWPVNAQVTRASAATPEFAVPAEVNRSVVSPLLNADGNESRCDLLESFERDAYWPSFLSDASQRSFQLFWSVPYCAESSGPKG